MSRHRQKRMTEAVSVELWEQCLRQIVQDKLIEFPEFREESRVAGPDGTTMKSVYTARIYAKRTRNAKQTTPRKVTNPKSVTPKFEGGSSFGANLPESKTGHGYIAVTIVNSRREALAVAVAPLPTSELPMAAELWRTEMRQQVVPYLGLDAKHPGVARPTERSRERITARRCAGQATSTSPTTSLTDKARTPSATTASTRRCALRLRAIRNGTPTASARSTACNSTTRFNLFKDKNYYKRLNQAKLAVLQTYVIQHAISAHYRRCVAAAAQGRPIPQPRRVLGVGGIKLLVRPARPPAPPNWASRAA
jgi:hypothetical protein